MRRSTAPFAILASIALLAGCAGSTPSWTYPPSATGVAAPSADAAAVPSGDPGPSLGTLTIEAFDLGFTPAALEVPAAGRYTIEMRNTGSIPHDIKFPGGEMADANSGQTATVEVDIPAGGLSFICSIPGHEQAGMTGSITVAGQVAASPAPDDHGGPAPATEVVADPNAPPAITHDATAPRRLAGKVHDIELVMTEQTMTVATGFVQKVWTFSGTVPGPVIRVKVGDTIRLTLKNPIENELPHSIDFHSSQVAWNDEMRSILPGEELVYEWSADYAGVWMYHCGTSPALHHIANGMYGMVIVEPEEGLPPVDAEFALVQSEWYLGPQGQPTDLTKAMAAAPAPDFVVFNGVASQYVDTPLTVKTGETVRVFVLNAGPSIDSSFHVVGTIFNTVIKEGVTLAKGNTGNWGAQAVDLSPAQGAIVEFTTAEDGLYPVVTHAFNFVGRGALGLIQAGDGDPAN
ncbi:MAG: multicopper oxidase domain-containing protein [Candidatus Limnocylindria bacterium]